MDQATRKGAEHMAGVLNQTNVRRRRLTAEEMKHNFAIERVESFSDEDKGAFLCHCVRCRWAFKVNPEFGTIFALDDAGEPLDDDAEAAKRIVSFKRGLCPAYGDLPEYAEEFAGSHRGILGILHPVLHLLGLDSAAQ
jgi:hypothetical protein